MECCGTSFSIGDTIKWPVEKRTQLNTPVKVGTIDYCYEAHDSSWQKLFVLEGIVENIKILYQRYAAVSEDPCAMVPVCGEIVEVKRAKGFEKLNGMEAGGYIVTLKGYTVRPAGKEDIAYQ